ncbi:MAG: response regulator [Lentisphaeria bacterium]|jgi:CheY-like chemotaxis protein|nr:response regulator [Lentisphaeria bacterium]
MNDSSASSANGRVLVMDDEFGIRDVVNSLLEMSGYEVTCVENGEQALDALTAAIDSGWRFDTILMDLQVNKGAGGLEIIGAVRDIDPDINAIVTSGNLVCSAEQDLATDYQSYGFDNALTKPFDFTELLAMVATGGRPRGDSRASDQIQESVT